ncbi:MAG: hypothetical protein RL336_416 [Pseudomonadota bacterium]
MVGQSIHIRDNLGALLGSRHAADTALKRNIETAVATLVGADFKVLRLGDAVEPGPVKTGHAVVELGHNGGHDSNFVVLAFAK